MDENCEIAPKILKEFEQNAKIRVEKRLRLDNIYLNFFLHTIGKKVRIRMAVGNDHLEVVERSQLDIDRLFMDLGAVHEQDGALRLRDRRFL